MSYILKNPPVVRKFCHKKDRQIKPFWNLFVYNGLIFDVDLSMQPEDLTPENMSGVIKYHKDCQQYETVKDEDFYREAIATLGDYDGHYVYSKKFNQWLYFDIPDSFWVALDPKVQEEFEKV